MPQIDELATLTSVLENKVSKLEEHCAKPQTNSTVFEAVVELTGKLKQEFSEFKERNEDFSEKVDATFRASQENTMKLQMVENQSRLQQESGCLGHASSIKSTFMNFVRYSKVLIIYAVRKKPTALYSI